jgi:hypothetical protein
MRARGEDCFVSANWRILAMTDKYYNIPEYENQIINNYRSYYAHRV